MNNAAPEHQDLPDRVLEQAIAWAVAMGAGGLDDASQHAFEQWLQAHALHRIAWQRLQMVESEFSGVRACPAAGRQVLLDSLSRCKRRSGLGFGAAGLLILIVLLTIPLVPRPQAVPATNEAQGPGMSASGSGPAAERCNKITGKPHFIRHG